MGIRHLEPELRLFCGAGCLDRLPTELDRLTARRVAVLCGETLAKQGSALNLLREVLGDRLAAVLPFARAHSPLPDVLTAASALREVRADAVIAVGGGSALVTARAAVIAFAEGPDLAVLATTIREGRPISPRLSAPKLPILVAPTTPTTAIVKTGSAVFDPVARQRLALFDPATRARAVFLHPDLLAGAPGHVFLSAGLNTLAMAVEGLISARATPLSDADLMQALRLCHRHLNANSGAEDRMAMTTAAVLCGRGTNQAGGGVTSALGHAVGARHGIENGIVNAIVLPHVLRANGSAMDRGLPQLAAALQVPPRDVIDTLRFLFASLPIPASLSAAGVPVSALPDLAQLAGEDWFLHQNIRPLSPEEIGQILLAAWHGAEAA